MKTIVYKPAFYCALIITWLILAIPGSGQDIKYYPKGDPGKWNVELTPFFVLPYVSGNVQSELLSEDFGIDPAGFISSLNGTIMFDMAVSRGKFFANAGYIFNYNGIETILWTSEDGTKSIVAEPELQRHILDVTGGMRFRLSDKFILDPYVGFRYTHYYLFGSVEGILNMKELDEKKDFWDPILGLQAHYYPHPRVPIELKADFGGFGAGSKFTWSVWFNTGYSVSPNVDLLIGFAALSNKYESETPLGYTYGMTSVTYGVDLGVRFAIPSRGKDPAVFKKAK